MLIKQLVLVLLVAGLLTVPSVFALSVDDAYLNYLNDFFNRLLETMGSMTGYATSSSKTTCMGVNATKPCIYGSYSIYTPFGGSSFIQVAIKDENGNTVAQDIISGWASGTSVTKTFSSLSLDVTVTSIAALTDGTVVGVNMVVGPTGTTISTTSTTSTTIVNTSTTSTTVPPSSTSSTTSTPTSATSSTSTTTTSITSTTIVSTTSTTITSSTSTILTSTTTTVPTTTTTIIKVAQPTEYGNYIIYPVMGSSDSWITLDINDSADNLVDSFYINQGNSKDSFSAGLIIKLVSVTANPDGTVADYKLEISSIPTTTTTISSSCIKDEDICSITLFGREFSIDGGCCPDTICTGERWFLVPYKVCETYSSTTTTTTTSLLNCSDGTFYGQCSVNKPKYCNIGKLVDDCSICGCSSGQICERDGKCYSKTSYSFQDCRGIICDGICYNGNVDCINNKVIYKNFFGKYFIHGEIMYSSKDLPNPFDVNVSYPKSIAPNETFTVEITITSKNTSVEANIDEVKFYEWKTGAFPFHYGEFSIPSNSYVLENRTSIHVSLPSNSTKTVSYELKAPTYPSPFFGRIFIWLDYNYYYYYQIVTNPITIYNPQNYENCGNKKFDPKVGSCKNNTLFPSEYERGCISNQMCPGNYPICIDHKCETRPNEVYFQTNSPYNIAIVPLYLVANKTLSDQLRITERSYMDSIAFNATNWWKNEKEYWDVKNNFSLAYNVIDCNMYVDEYLLLAQQNSNDAYKTYKEIVSKCNIDRNTYKSVAFIHVIDPNVAYPFYMGQNLGDIMLVSGADSVDVLIHETLHAFGAPDEYVNPGQTSYQYDCFLNILNKNILNNTNRHLCPMEAFLIGLI